MNIQIAIIISAFGLCITIPIFMRYFAYANLPFWGKCLSFVLSLIIAILPIFAARSWANIYGEFFPFVEHLFYFIYIFAIILFAITFMRDLIWFMLHFLKILPSPFVPTLLTKTNIVTACLALICTTWSLYEGLKVPDPNHLILPNAKIVQEKTVVVLSDLHISRTTNPQKIKEIVNRTNATKPDIVLLAGDIIDDEINLIHPTTSLLSELKARQGVYFVSGNHEFYIGYQAAIKELENLGFTSLENKKIAIEPNFYVAGTSDIPTTARFGKKSNLKKVLSDIPNTAYTLFVSHSPTPLNLPFDLQVSGHTHGGQVFPFHVLSWLGNHHLLAGFYPNERIYISRGSGQWGPQMRFFAPSEITILHLKNTQN